MACSRRWPGRRAAGNSTSSAVRAPVGVTQVLPSTALWALQFLVDGADNWQSSALDNARVGASFMKHLLDVTGGNVATAVAAYYQGWDSVQIHGLYDDTKQYVANVLALWPQFKS